MTTPVTGVPGSVFLWHNFCWSSPISFSGALLFLLCAAHHTGKLIVEVEAGNNLWGAQERQDPGAPPSQAQAGEFWSTAPPVCAGAVCSRFDLTPESRPRAGRGAPVRHL